MGLRIMYGTVKIVTMQLSKKALFSGLEFWIAVVVGWLAFSLIWREEAIVEERLEKCSPCVEKTCKSCSIEDSAPAISLGDNDFYRDYPWKPLNFVEAHANNYKLFSKKFRNGMQNDDPRVGINGMWRLEREQLKSRIKSLMRSSQSFSNEATFTRMMRKLDPFYGVSYLAQMNSEENVELFEIRRKFQHNKPLLIDINHTNQKEMIYIIIPLSKVSERFHKFLKRLEDNLYTSKRKSFEKLIFVIFGKRNDEDVIETLQALKKFKERNQDAQMEYTLVKGDFSRAVGLDSGVKMCPPNALVLFLDVDLIITPDFLDRVRANTIKNKQVLFPIVFSQFDPTVIENYAKSKWYEGHQTINSSITEDKGFWIHYAFGIAAMYKSDYFAVGGFALDIIGWGGEDVNLFKKFVSSRKIDVMSTVDPDLIHIYHSRACDPSLTADQYRMCIGSLSETIGSQEQLSRLYLQKKARHYFDD